MAQPADHLLLSAMSKMIVSYLPQQGANVTVCQIVTAFDPKPPVTRPTCDNWSSQYASGQAQDILTTKVKNQDDGLRLLGYIAQYGLPIYSKGIPSMQACSPQLDFSNLEYGYLWDGVGDTSFCRVRIPQDGTINYNPISRLQKLADDASTTNAVGIIISQYRDVVPLLHPDSMRQACSSLITYAQIKDSALRPICGCYVEIQNDESFSSDEKIFLAQNPQCLPSCLTAPVRYTTGGPPIVCQQNVCIADDIDVTGTTTTITQICPQCTHTAECVCYIHINGSTINNSACGMTYQINDKGQITGSSENKPPAFGKGFRQAFEDLIGSRTGLIVLVVAAALIIIVIIIVLVVKHTRGRTSSKRRTISGSSPYSYQTPGVELQ